MAVISSALCGMVSGSSVGNTVTTGSVTIPMMKKTGYKPEFAGAVEADGVRAEQGILGVVDVEQHGGVLVALERERGLDPVVAPSHLRDLEGDVRVDLLVLVEHGDHRVSAFVAPGPVAQFDGLAVVDQVVGVVGDGVAHDGQALVGLGVDDA